MSKHKPPNILPLYDIGRLVPSKQNTLHALRRSCFLDVDSNTNTRVFYPNVQYILMIFVLSHVETSPFWEESYILQSSS